MTQLDLGLSGGRKKPKRRKRLKGRQEFTGVRFAPWHPAIGFGRDPKLVRTWNGLRRALGWLKTKVRVCDHSIDRIVIRATTDRGATWRPATPEEQRLFMESVK